MMGRPLVARIHRSVQILQANTVRPYGLYLLHNAYCMAKYKDGGNKCVVVGF